MQKYSNLVLLIRVLHLYNMTVAQWLIGCHGKWDHCSASNCLSWAIQYHMHVFWIFYIRAFHSVPLQCFMKAFYHIIPSERYTRWCNQLTQWSGPSLLWPHSMGDVFCCWFHACTWSMADWSLQSRNSWGYQTILHHGYSTLPCEHELVTWKHLNVVNLLTMHFNGSTLEC